MSRRPLPFTVEENLDFFADLYSVPSVVREQRKEALLAWSRLSPFRQRRAIHLSGGMQKKLHLCCTLIHEPDLLLLDEPTTGVDPVSRRELWEILYDLVGRGLTLVVTTPYMDEAERCYRVAFMHQGRILHCDRPEALRREIHEVAWEMTAPDLLQVQDLLHQAGLRARTHRIGNHLRVLTSPRIDVADEIARVVNANDPIDLHLRKVPLTMEDVFVSMVMGTMDAPKSVDWHPSRPSSGSVRMPTDDVAVRVKDLTRTFGEFVAVDHVSLAVNRRE
ncbi:MAG: ATP-binding cassette domain-containing protein, partial [Candidatus Tectomicrobia bacterium]|nr:ATP-binding cassette domain-containing protein [Candidatus Tectomicrobia bacterium]